MKIIFDSEKQKERFVNNILAEAISCPDTLGFSCGGHCLGFPCRECWETCGIEMKVEEKENVPRQEM